MASKWFLVSLSILITVWSAQNRVKGHEAHHLGLDQYHKYRETESLFKEMEKKWVIQYFFQFKGEVIF